MPWSITASDGPEHNLRLHALLPHYATTCASSILVFARADQTFEKFSMESVHRLLHGIAMLAVRRHRSRPGVSRLLRGLRRRDREPGRGGQTEF
jgi:hypothetical protein